MDLAQHKTINNEQDSRFELNLEEGRVLIDYKIGKSGSWYLVHTEVPDHLEGKGAGHKIVREALEIIEEIGVKIIPTCPFVRAFIKRHLTDYEHLLADGVKL